MSDADKKRADRSRRAKVAERAKEAKKAEETSGKKAEETSVKKAEESSGKKAEESTGRKAKKKKKKIKESDLSGFRDLRAIAKLLEPLHQIGTERDKAGNRNLHMDEYCLLVLMWLYNPVIDSLGGLQQASD